MFLMNALQSDQPTDQQTDTAYYRDARTHLKRKAVTWRSSPAPMEHISGLSLALMCHSVVDAAADAVNFRAGIIKNAMLLSSHRGATTTPITYPESFVFKCWKFYRYFSLIELD